MFRHLLVPLDGSAQARSRRAPPFGVPSAPAPGAPPEAHEERSIPAPLGSVNEW